MLHPCSALTSLEDLTVRNAAAGGNDAQLADFEARVLAPLFASCTALRVVRLQKLNLRIAGQRTRVQACAHASAATAASAALALLLLLLLHMC